MEIDRLAIAFVVALTFSAGARADEADLAKLSWLAGCWKNDGAEPGSGEMWMPPAGGTMLGVSRTVKQGKTIAHEFMQIRATAPGKLAFIAQPSGQREATFPLLRLTDTVAIFENLEHDFPQRVIYGIDPDGRLSARIEGMSKGELRLVPFRMSRVSCQSWQPSSEVAAAPRTSATAADTPPRTSRRSPRSCRPRSARRAPC